MELARAYKFRIYPDFTRQEEIDERLVLAQQFYNKLLEKSIQSYKSGNHKTSMAQFNRFVKEIIQEDKKYLKLLRKNQSFIYLLLPCGVRVDSELVGSCQFHATYISIHIYTPYYGSLSSHP